MSTTIAVVVVSYGSCALVVRNLAALPATARVVVVDNYSTPEERDRMARVADRSGWLLIAPDGNLGFGDGVNLGVERAFAEGADVVCVLNPDASVAEDVLRELARTAREAPRALVAPRIVDGHGRVTFDGAEVDVANGRTRRGSVATAGHPWLSGACLAFTQEAWVLSGGFSSQYFLYWEDVELSWRIRTQGGDLVLASDLQVVHDAGGTQTSSRVSGKSPTYVYYNCRNRLVFAARNLSDDVARLWARSSVRYAREVLLRGGSRRVLLSPRHLWAAVSGTFDGLRIVHSARRAEIS